MIEPPTSPPTAPVPEGEAIVATFEPTTAPIVRRPLAEAESRARLADHLRGGLERLQQRTRLAAAAESAQTEGAQEKAAREAREAEETERARRHQAETRRHFEAIAQERLETLVEDVAEAVFSRVMGRIERGLADLQTEQAIRLDRIAGDVRAQVRAFLRGTGKTEEGI